MRAWNGIDVGLRVGNWRLTEFERPSEYDAAKGGTALTTYVEAVAGSTFTVQILLPPQWTLQINDAILCSVFLDGKFATGRICNRSHFGFHPHILTIEGVERMNIRGHRELERFTFAQLQTNDDPLTASTKPEHFKDFGTIAITLTWCHQISQGFIGLQNSIDSTVDTSIPEKCLKGRAISSRAGTAKPELIAGVIASTNLAYPYGNFPFTTFNFQYRSWKDLQIEGIIQNDPVAVALEDRDPNSLSTEEVRQLQQQLHAKREGALVKIKQEKRDWIHADDRDGEADVKIVSDGPVQKKRKSTASGMELIDLTDA